MANQLAEPDSPAFICDAVDELGVHNGVVRISFIRLLADSRPVPSVELLLPVAVVAQVIKALQNVKP